MVSYFVHKNCNLFSTLFFWPANTNSCQSRLALLPPRNLMQITVFNKFVNDNVHHDGTQLNINESKISLYLLSYV